MSSKKAVTVKDIPASTFIVAYASHLKRGKIQLPEWVDVVKTSRGAQNAPLNSEWFYIRSASIARKIYLRGTLGVGMLTRLYSHPRTEGLRSPRYAPGSPSVARKVLKNLENLGIIEKDPKGGRRLTPNGRRELDRIAVAVSKSN